MSAIHSRWSSVGIVTCCLALTALTGCKSGFKAPGADWLSWGKPKPSASSLAGAPRRPSAGALPTPSATTARASSPYGQAGYGAGATGQTGYASQSHAGHSHGSGTTNGYQTGPYSSGATNGLAGTQGAGAAGPYSSPYQASQTGQSGYGGGSAYGVADSRGSTGYQATTAAGTGASKSWNSDPYRRAGDPSGSGQATTASSTCCVNLRKQSASSRYYGLPSHTESVR